MDAFLVLKPLKEPFIECVYQQNWSNEPNTNNNNNNNNNDNNNNDNNLILLKRYLYGHMINSTNLQYIMIHTILRILFTIYGKV